MSSADAHTLLDAPTLRLIRDVVEAALDEASVCTLSHFRQPIQVDNKLVDGFDPVTIADREAEQVLQTCLMAALPHAGFLGEEGSGKIEAPANSHDSGSTDPATATASLGQRLDPSTQSALTWVVDPIDGTRAFITGLPLWGTLVALNNGQQVVFGALDQPWLGERFIGDANGAVRIYKGAEQTLQVHTARPLHECIVQTTTPDMFDTETSRQGFAAVQRDVAMVRYGGDCYAYALLAMGGVDAVIESALQPYDIQALIPIVQGAGGVITNWEGAPCLEGGSVVASSNPGLHHELLQRLSVNR